MKEKEERKISPVLDALDQSIAYQEFLLRLEREKTREAHGRIRSTQATRHHVDQIRDLKEKRQELIENSRQAWQQEHEKILLGDIQRLEEGKMQALPYVEEAKEKIIQSLELGTPVYLVGHLGSGKTQLASEAAMEFTIRRRKYEELKTFMDQWQGENPTQGEEEAEKAFGLYNKELNRKYQQLDQMDAQERERLQPLFISGSHSLTYEDMFIEKTLVLQRSFSEGSYADYLNTIMVDFFHWMEEHRERLAKMTDEEELQLKIQIWKSFSDLFIASNSAYGTEVKKIEREILRAVQEGRPVIVDELNTIAMQNLIGLNDILQRRAGSTAYVTGLGPVKIREGFAFIGTGNLSTAEVSYEGTNQLNPAFKSRFVTIEYNYLPQKTLGDLKNTENIQDQQLFRLILTSLLDREGRLELPNPDQTLDQLYRLAQLAGLTQKVFMGKWKENKGEEGSLMEEPQLRESVLSIRNLLQVLDNWNMGEEKDLSKALWDGFISSLTLDDDKNYILAQAKNFGFFRQTEGWHIEEKSLGEKAPDNQEIRIRPYRYQRQASQELSLQDLTQIIFGPAPQGEEENKEQASVDKYQELDQTLRHMEHSNFLLDYLDRQGGSHED